MTLAELEVGRTLVVAAILVTTGTLGDAKMGAAD